MLRIVLALSLLLTVPAVLADDAKSASAGKESAAQKAHELESGSDVLMPQFHQLDRNGDGYLSKDEIQAWPRGAAAGEFERADLDKNGKLDAAEFKVLFANTSEDRRLGSK